MEIPVMNYPKCPACGHELLDRTDQCPFCGNDLSRRLLRSSGAQTNHLRKIISLVAVMMAISGAAFTYFFAMNSRSATAGTGKVSEQVMPQDANAEHCFENMNRILDAEDEYLDQNGRYTDNIDELHRFDSTLNPVCPGSGLPYTIINTKQSIQVICSVHGEI